MKIVVYGTVGCSGCKAMLTKIKSAAEKHSVSADIFYETDLKKAIEKGIMSLPALEVDGVIRKVSHVPKDAELMAIFFPESRNKK